MISCYALVALAATATLGCGEDSAGVFGPLRVAGGGDAQPPAFQVRDSAFVHVGIGREVLLRIDAGSHPLRPAGRDLVPANWSVRNAAIATVTAGVLRGRAEGDSWLVWSQDGQLDSVPLVVSAAPVGYLEPRRLLLDVNAPAVPFSPPVGDSLVFCASPPAGSGIEVSVANGARATKEASLAMRCRTREGLTAALMLAATTASVPPSPPAPESPPGSPPPPVPPVPPVPGTRTVSLQLHRFAGAEASTVTSNAIPLPPGWVRPAAVDSISLRVGGVEVPAHVSPLFGKHPDGSLRSVLLQADIGPDMASQGTTLLIGTPRTRSRPALASIPGPNQSGVLLPGDVDYLVTTQVVGQTVSRTAMTGAPTHFAEYESKFDQFQQLHWDARGDLWTENFYDRALAYFAFWVRTGNPLYWERGARIAVNYRFEYLEKNGYGAAEWWSYLEGLAVHYWLTGDARSRDAVYMTAENLHRSRGGAQLANNTTHPWMDNRVQAKVLGGKVLSLRLEAPAFGAVGDWRAMARTDLGMILGTQAPDGAYRFGSICGESNNFMAGILGSVMIEYHDFIDPDPRIPVALSRNMNFMRNTQWRPADLVFNYYSGPCTQGGPTPGWDLNGFYLESMGWLARHEQDPAWIEFADLVLQGLMAKTWMFGPKQFTQAYNLSWRYHWYRAQMFN